MLVWADGFDHYGTSVAMMQNAGYTAGVFGGIGATGGRGNSGYINNNSNSQFRRALDNPATTVGVGVALMVVGLGGQNVNGSGIRIESAGPTFECSIVVQPDLSLGVYDRTSVFKGKTPANSLPFNTWGVWVEVKCIGNVGGVVNTGSIEVRINGISKLIINGMNFPNIFAYTALGGFANGLSNVNWDDYIVWDGTGLYNNDFMGDRRCVTLFPNANGALQDFVPSVAPAWDCINNDPAVDTTYIEGAAAGNISEFTKTGITINANDIAAMVVIGRMFKSDAGVASGRLGINSSGNVLNSAELFPGVGGTYFSSIIERDPNGTIAWTKAAADAALPRITRVQ